MTLSCRPVCDDDLPVIRDFAGNALELFFFMPNAVFPLSLAQLTGTIKQRTAPTVILYDGNVAGFADLYDCHPGNSCRIGNVIVSPHYRGRGVASHLIQRMVEIATDTFRAAHVELACFNNNTAGLLLYPKLGFQPYAIEPRQGPDGEPLALIQLRLSI